MNWKHLRAFPWIDTRIRFISQTPANGSLLDLGSSDGETLRHISELRPDLGLCSADLFGHPENYPAHCDFKRVDFNTQPLPWPDGSLDAISCMHVVEHLGELSNLLREVSRILKPGGRAYFETPHPKTLKLPSARGKFTLNFFDDPTHTQVVRVEQLAIQMQRAGLQVMQSGISRNWFFAACYPFLWLTPESRRKYTAQVHWLGWSAYLIAGKPQ